MGILLICYKGITLLNIMLKVYERTVKKLLQLKTEIEPKKAQSEFRKGRGFHLVSTYNNIRNYVIMNNNMLSRIFDQERITPRRCTFLNA